MRYFCLGQWNCNSENIVHIVAKANETQAKLEVEQDSVQLIFSVSFQLQLPFWTPDYSILQGGMSLLPDQRGGRGGGSTRILHHQLPPVPGHRTVGSAHSSCACLQPLGHTCTHILHMQSIYTLTIPSCPAQVSCWLWNDCCVFDIEGKMLFFFKEDKVICTIHLDTNTLSPL